MRSRTRKKPIVAPELNARMVGARIRRIREDEKHWSLLDLARIAGINYGTLYAYESGQRLPIHANLVRLSLALNRRIDFLLTGKYEKRKTRSGSRAVESSRRHCPTPDVMDHTNTNG